VTRRVPPPREAAKAASSLADKPTRSTFLDRRPSKAKELLQKSLKLVKGFGYRKTFSAAWWLVALPVFVLGLHLLCSKDNCYIRFNPTIPKTLKVYADPVVISYGFGVVLLQCLLSAIPLGKVVPGFGYRRVNFQYRSNSLLCLVVSVALYLFAVFYLRLPNTAILQTHRFKCVAGATILSFLISLGLYFKSLKAPSSHLNHGSPCGPGITGNPVHDFVHGREVSPKIGKVFDLGQVLVRTANCLWVLAVISAALQARGSGPVFGWNYNIALVSSMQLLYVFCGSLNEVYLLKSAFIQQGVGFLSVFSILVLTPFCATLPLRYLVDTKAPDDCLLCYPGLAGLFLVGLFLVHYSNCLKYNNARHSGKTLRTGPWRFVRHPNYLGEVLCILAWTLPCRSIALPYAHLAFVVLNVICRSRMCEKNTNADYRGYMSQVKYRLVPFIF